MLFLISNSLQESPENLAGISPENFNGLCLKFVSFNFSSIRILCAVLAPNRKLA